MKKLFAILMMFSMYAMGSDNICALPTTGNVTLTLAEYNRLVELATNPASSVRRRRCLTLSSAPI